MANATVSTNHYQRLLGALNLAEGGLAADNGNQADVEARLAAVRREDVTHPTLFIGAGTCGLGAGAAKTLEAIQQYVADKDLQVDIVEVGCIGLCTCEPMMDVQLPGRARLSFSNVTARDVPKLLDSTLDGAPDKDRVLGQFRSEAAQPWQDLPYLDEHPFFKPQTRRVLANCGTIDPTSLQEYVAHGGYRALTRAVTSMTREELCDMVEASGLRGRGGGGFPAGLKWKLALREEAEQKYVICNADEGDPGAFMDRALIEGDPHRMLEGLALAAYAIGATRAYVYIRAEYPLAIERLKEAIAQAKTVGLLGENIHDSGFGLEVKIKMGAGAFVCGEETALMHSIEGKRGMPRPRPPFPAAKGLFGKPTVINNVETLSNLPGLVDRGIEWYRGVGTERSPGTKIFALSGKVSRTGLVEVAMGMPLRDIVFEIGGGIPDGKAFKAVQIGGPSGGCIPTAQLDTIVDYDALRAAGAMMGSGGLVVMDEDTCMVDVAAFFMDFIQRESCGKCIPCREGTRRMLDILHSLTRSRRDDQGWSALERFRGVMQLEKLANVIRDTSLCGLGQSAPNPVLSTLRHFREEYEAHVYERKCPSVACRELLTYVIDPDACNGCHLCARQCPAGAIVGEPKATHLVLQEHCIHCGACVDACRKEAISAT